MRKPRLVVVGNGMAGIRTLEELLKLVPDMYDITVFGAEPHPNYNRILLSPVLAGEMQIQDIILNELDWYAENGIRLHTGKTVTQIDRVRRLVIADDGTAAPYDRLLIATGSTPFRLPIPGNQLPGVIGYRDIQDTDEMIAAASQYRHAVVIGGGLLGRQVGAGVATQLRGVIRLAVGLCRADAGGILQCVADVALVPRDHALVGRADGFQQRRACLGLERLGFRRVDRPRLAQRVGLLDQIGPQRGVVALRERRTGDHVARLGDDAGVGELRCADAGVGAGLRVFEQGVEHLWQRT